jgi:hypothetical protein
MFICGRVMRRDWAARCMSGAKTAARFTMRSGRSLRCQGSTRLPMLLRWLLATGGLLKIRDIEQPNTAICCGGGLVLSRPNQHVAWRCDRATGCRPIRPG